MKKILVVDDDIVIIRLFQLQLRRSPYQGYYFQDSDQALAQLDDIEPDLAVLDYHLPGKDGPALLEVIRQKPVLASIPVIFVTGEAARSNLDKIKTDPNVQILTKPFSPKQLTALMATMLEPTT